jgi:hypothetical protein
MADDIVVAPQEGQPLLQRLEPIEAWIRSLSPRRQAAVLQYTQAERSPVLSYLYASLLGMEGIGVDEWEAWVLRRFRKMDHLALLEAEIARLQSDLDNLREAAYPLDPDAKPKIRIGELPTKVSYLARELRGHIETMTKMQSMHDRRSLLLAGVDVLSKNLRKVYGRDATIWPAIEATIEASWADIETRHKAA